MTRLRGPMGESVNERELFLEALEILDPVARASYLRAVCSGDDSLRLRIESLLVAYGNAADFLESPAMATVDLHLPCPSKREPKSGRTNCWSRSAKGAWASSIWPINRRRCGGR